MSAADGTSWIDQLAATSLTDAWILARVLIAAVLSGAIGWERERSERDAGLRTHMLVGISAALLISLGEPLVERYKEILEDDNMIRFDPSRLIDAMITGVSFLGAGTIFVSGHSKVQGLTTAASILATATVGIAVGLGRYALGIGSTILIMIVLAVLRRFAIRDKE